MKLTPSAKWNIASVVLVVLILAASWTLAVSPKLAEAEQARSDRENVEHQNTILRTRIAALKEQAEGLDTVIANMAAVHDHMPYTHELSPLIRAVWEAGTASGVFMANLEAEVPEAIGAAPPTQAIVPEADPVAETAGNLESAQDAPADPNTPVPGDGAAPAPEDGAAAPEEAPADFIEGLYAIPVTVTAYGNNVEIEAFIERLQDLQRFFLPTTVVIESMDEAELSPPLPAMEMGDAMLTITGYVYVLTPATSLEIEFAPEVPGDLPADPLMRNPYIGLGRTVEEALGPNAVLTPPEGETPPDGEAPPEGETTGDDGEATTEG